MLWLVRGLDIWKKILRKLRMFPIQSTNYVFLSCLKNIVYKNMVLQKRKIFVSTDWPILCFITKLSQVPSPICAELIWSFTNPTTRPPQPGNNSSSNKREQIKTCTKFVYNCVSYKNSNRFKLNIFKQIQIKLSKLQPQHNSTVGFDMKMTVQTPPHPPPTETFQPLLDQLESWNLAQIFTRPIWLR